jgi:hypothetical protein
MVAARFKLRRLREINQGLQGRGVLVEHAEHAGLSEGVVRSEAAAAAHERLGRSSKFSG